MRSQACSRVVALVVAATRAGRLARPAPNTILLLILGVAAGGTAAGRRNGVAAHVCAATQGAAPVERRAGELRKNLLTAEAIIKAEPQVLVFWEQGQGVRVMVHTLAGVAGLPPPAPRAAASSAAGSMPPPPRS